MCTTKYEVLKADGESLYFTLPVKQVKASQAQADKPTTLHLHIQPCLSVPSLPFPKLMID